MKAHYPAIFPFVAAARYCLFAMSWLVCTQAIAMSLDLQTTPVGDVFPALELSQSTDAVANPAQGSGLLRLHLGDVHMPRDIRLTLSTPGLRRPTVIDMRVTAETTLRPRLEWDALALLGLKHAREQIMQVQLEGRGMKSITRQFKLRVHPLDEALYFVREGDARIDLGWAFAAWVDPGDPVIDDLLALANINALTVRASTLDRDKRLQLVRSLWIALERRGLRYADEGAGLSQGPVIYSQRVRLLSSTWNERVANCLDGSVLIASALERLGIGSLLVLVPGHAFVGFYLDNDRRDAEFLETTLLGYRNTKTFGKESAEQLRQRALIGFSAARRAGRERYRLAYPKLDGRHRPDFALIDISTARTYGIMPLAIGRSESRTGVPVATSTSAILSSSTSPTP